jgi:hypothetical protein
VVILRKHIEDEVEDGMRRRKPRVGRQRRILEELLAAAATPVAMRAGSRM